VDQCLELVSHLQQVNPGSYFEGELLEFDVPKLDCISYTPNLPVGETDKVGAVWNLGNLDMTFEIS
jgi:hypothetical protein